MLEMVLIYILLKKIGESADKGIRETIEKQKES